MEHRVRGVTLFLVLVLVAPFPSLAQQAAWHAVVADASERGERMAVTGRVIDKATGKALSGVEVYVYQTDAKGIYGDSPRTPRLKATMYTRNDGTYEFVSIRPGSYPNEKILAHVHYVVYADGYKEWQGELVFEDDPLLTPERRKEVEKDPSMLLRPITRDRGIWHVSADVALLR